MCMWRRTPRMRPGCGLCCPPRPGWRIWRSTGPIWNTLWTRSRRSCRPAPSRTSSTGPASCGCWRVSGETGYAELPKPHRICEACRYSLGLLDPGDHLHDYLVGTPTLSAAEHATLAEPGYSNVIQILGPSTPDTRVTTTVKEVA